LTSRALVALLTLLGAAACKKKPEPVHRTEPWLAQPSGSAAQVTTGAPRSFHFALGESNARFSVAGRKGKISGRAPVSGGKLSLDPHDLKNASGDVEVDLTKLGIDDAAVPEGIQLSGSASTVAQQWLELGEAVASERRAQFGTARFDLTGTDNLSLSGLDFGAAHPRRSRATAVGTLLIHGFKEPVRAEVWLEPLPPRSGSPVRLSIRSAAALVIALAPHDITARGPSGIVDALAMARSAEYVGKSVRVEFELVAEADGVAK
jgi:polyisoprenoid-binding protein YceI